MLKKSCTLLEEHRQNFRYSKVSSVNIIDTEESQPGSNEFSLARPRSQSHKKKINLETLRDFDSVISKECETKPIPFTNILFCQQFLNDEKFARTCFHQIVQEIERAYSNGRPLSMITPDSLSIVNKNSLRINEEFGNMKKQFSDYHAPEFKTDELINAESAVIYSLGMILFVFKTGYLPFINNSYIAGHNLKQLFHSNIVQFWILFGITTINLYQFSDELKVLIESMTRPDPMKRITLRGVKSSKWFKGSIYSASELEGLVSRNLQ